jgi:pseudaminic acid synthase
VLVNNRLIAYGSQPYIVAEIGASHNGNIDTARDLIKIAKDAGAEAVKFQCFTPDTITFNGRGEAFTIKDGPWKGERLYDLYTRAHTPRDWFPELFEMALSIGITPFASVFSPEDVDFMERMGNPIYKISSFEIVDIPLIKYVARLGKPIIMSTGMASTTEVASALEAATSRNTPRHNVVLLHCISSYPANVSDMPLGKMARNDGISDHSFGSTVPIAAAAMGASIIEKHLTVSRSNGGLDDGFAMEPAEFSSMVKSVRAISAARFSTKASTREHAPLRRSLYFVRPMMTGAKITKEDVRSIRPAGGLHPGMIDSIIGSEVTQDVEAGTPVTMEMISGKLS